MNVSLVVWLICLQAKTVRVIFCFQYYLPMGLSKLACSFFFFFFPPFSDAEDFFVPDVMWLVNTFREHRNDLFTKKESTYDLIRSCSRFEIWLLYYICYILCCSKYLVGLSILWENFPYTLNIRTIYIDWVFCGGKWMNFLIRFNGDDFYG